MAGRKRHLLVDTLGLILLAKVHAADVKDRDGARQLLAALATRFGWLRCIWADGGYAGALVGWVRQLCPRRGTRLEIVKHAPSSATAKILPPPLGRRGAFAWLGRSRRLRKDCEHTVSAYKIFHLSGQDPLMLNRLADLFRRPLTDRNY